MGSWRHGMAHDHSVCEQEPTPPAQSSSSDGSLAIKEDQSHYSLAQIPSSRLLRFHRNSITQLLILSALYLCGLGIWNALNSLGGLGTGDESLAHYANVVGYFVGIPAGAVAGGIINILGLKKSVMIGTIGQAGAIFFYYIYFYRKWVPLYGVLIFGVFEGFTASMFMSGVSSGAIHYAIDSQRSHFIAVNSAILNVGGVVGAVIGFTMNLHDTSTEGNRGLSEPSYRAIVITAACGILISFFLCEPEQVIRKDGTKAHIPLMHVRQEIKALGKGIVDPNLWLLAPLFMAAFWHEVVLFNFFNTSLFNVRSRAVNAGFYFVARILASFIIRYACDCSENLRKRIAAAVGTLAFFLVIAFTMSLMVFCGAFGILHSSAIDVTESRAAVVIVAFIAYGALETMCSSTSLWIIGVLPFESANAANRYIGWYRMFGSLGGLISWALDIKGLLPHLAQWIVNIALWILALSCTLFLSHKVLKRAESKIDGMSKMGSLASILPSTESSF